MGNSNVARLADYQGAEGVVRDPDDVLADLSELGEEPEIPRVACLTEELARGLREAKQLTVAMYRERFIRALGGKLGVPARFFDNALADVTGPRSVESEDAQQGKVLAFENPEPWPVPVDGSEILGDLKAVFERYVVLGDDALTVLALWVAHTYVFDAAWITPRLAIISPEKRCGKTLVLTFLRYLVAKPLQSANASPAAIFRISSPYPDVREQHKRSMNEPGISSAFRDPRAR